MARAPLGQFFTALLKLTRTGNLFIIAFAQYLTALFLIGYETLDDLLLLILTISTVLVAAGGYIINDYYDIKIDYINKPDRVIIGKRINRRYAILLHISLSLLGILLGLMLSWSIAFVNALSVFLLWLYSNLLKRLPFVGNLTIALLTSFSILIVDLYYRTQNPLILVYALFAFFTTLIREIIKDMEDLKGDNTFGCKTLPIVLGIRRTKGILYVITILFLLFALLSVFVYEVFPSFLHIAWLGIPVGYLLIRLIRADTKRDFSILSSYCKIIMLLGILSMTLI